MRKLKLLLVTLAMIVGGALSSWADTTLLTAGDGWQKITEMPTDVSLYYFTIVDNSQDLMLTLSRGLNSHQGTDYNGLFYGTSANPLIDKSKLFSLEKDGENYVLRNVEYNGYFLQTENNAAWNYRTHDNGGGGKSWGHIKFTYGEGVWTIQNAKYAVDNGNYMGMWDNAAPANGKDIALNKGADAKGTFQIYAILKTTVEAYYTALREGKTLGATPGTPVDMTALIVNPNARFWKDSKPFGWTTTGTQNINNGNGYDGFPGIFEYSDWGADAGWTGSLKQTIAVPNGKYLLKAAVMAESDVTAYLTANEDQSTNLEPIGASGGNINADGTETTMGNGQRGFKYLTVETTVTTGSLELGTYASATAKTKWVNADNFTLSYLDPFISVVATDIPAATATALSANAWYKFTAASTDNFSFATTTIDDIIYTTTDQLQSTATGSNATATMALTSETTYYIKSTSAQTLTITPQTFTYTVGDGTPSVADGKYTQTNTFTLTFADYATDDPDASFQILDASKIKVNSAAATASLTDNVLTITLADALTASTDYAISVAAGAVGYKAEADKSNAAIALKVHTPAVFDGHYYIKKDGADLFFSRGGSQNKQTVLDAYGVPVKITTDGSNVSRVKFVDTGLLLGASGSSTMYWTDKGTGTPAQIDWTIKKNGDKYKFYLDGMSDDKKGMNIHTNGTEPKSDTEANACDWELELPAAHPTKLQAIKDAQAADVATAMSITGVSTQAQMAAKLAAEYGTTNIAITGTGGTNREAWQQTAPIEDPFELAVFAEETVNDLKPGIYRLRVYGFERIADGQSVYDAGGAAGLAYVYATSNSVTAKVKLASVFDVQADTPWKSGNDLEFGGKYYPNGQDGAQKAFDADKYANDVYVQVVDEGSGTGSIKFGIKQPNAYYSGSSVHNNAQWICYNNFSLTFFEAKPTDGQKEALADAITAAEAKTLGFETGEYAPYANADALEALAAAKAINPSTASGDAVVAATNDLTGASWTANASDVECVYNGNFAIGQGSPAAEIQKYGWTRTNGWGQFRNDGVSSTTGYYNQPGSLQYGNAGVYTMPLAASTIYSLTFKYASWEDNSNDGMTVSVLNGENGMAAKTFEEYNTKYTSGFGEQTILFVTSVAGNYVLTLANSGNTVITGVSITKAANQYLEFADGAPLPKYAPGTYPSVKITRSLTANKWVTAVYPFVISDANVNEIVDLSSYNAVTGELGFISVSASTVNKPFMMRSTTDKDEITLTDVGVEDIISTPKRICDEASLIGVYTTTTVDNTAKNYVLSNNTIYYIGENSATVNPYRAYIQIAQGGEAPALTFTFDDEATAIEGINANESDDDDAFYNLQGQQVTNPQNGIYIHKGRKIWVR